LKILIGEAYDFYPEDVSIEDIRRVMIDIVKEYIIDDNPNRLFEFMNEISPECFYKWADPRDLSYIEKPHPNYDFNRAVIIKCISMLNCLRVLDGSNRLISFNRPNFNLLPKKNEHTNLNEWEWDD